jgi:hypothetical protein
MTPISSVPPTFSLGHSAPRSSAHILGKPGQAMSSCRVLGRARALLPRSFGKAPPQLQRACRSRVRCIQSRPPGKDEAR